MKNLTLNEQQEIYGGGFEEGREIGHAIGSTLTGALALFGAYVFFQRIHSYCIEKNICESLL